MGKEIIPIKQIEIRKDRLTQILAERVSLIGRIGTGEVKVGSSWENTLKVGRVRSVVKASVNRKKEELNNLNQELDAYGQARGYLNELDLRQRQLAEMSEMVAQGNLSKDDLHIYQSEYEKLVSLPQKNPTLQSGIERLKAEEAKEKEGNVTLVTPGMSKVGAEKPEDTEGFELPNGKAYKGKTAKLLSLLSHTSEDKLVTIDGLSEALYPGIVSKEAERKTSALLSRIRKLLIGTDWSIICFYDRKGKNRNEKGLYYLNKATPLKPTEAQYEDEGDIIEDVQSEGVEPIVGFEKSAEKTSRDIILDEDIKAVVSHEEPTGETVIYDASVETIVASPVMDIPKIKLTESKPKPKAIELQDPQIRDRINAYFNDVLSRPDFQQPASSVAINRVFDRLKNNTFNKAYHDKYIVAADRRNGHPRFDAIAITTLLYLYDYGDNLPRRLKRQIRDIVVEELKKRQVKKPQT